MGKTITITILIAIVAVLGYREYERFAYGYMGLVTVESEEFDELKLLVHDMDKTIDAVDSKTDIALMTANAAGRASMEVGLGALRVAKEHALLEQRVSDLITSLSRGKDGGYVLDPPKSDEELDKLLFPKEDEDAKDN